MQRVVVRVLPGARRERLAEDAPGKFTVSVREAAQGGRANARVRELLAAHYGVAVHMVRFETGARSRRKRVTIEV